MKTIGGLAKSNSRRLQGHWRQAASERPQIRVQRPMRSRGRGVSLPGCRPPHPRHREDGESRESEEHRKILPGETSHGESWPGIAREFGGQPGLSQLPDFGLHPVFRSLMPKQLGWSHFQAGILKPQIAVWALGPRRPLRSFVVSQPVSSPPPKVSFPSAPLLVRTASSGSKALLSCFSIHSRKGRKSGEVGTKDLVLLGGFCHISDRVLRSESRLAC